MRVHAGWRALPVVAFALLTPGAHAEEGAAPPTPQTVDDFKGGIDRWRGTHFAEVTLTAGETPSAGQAISFEGLGEKPATVGRDLAPSDWRGMDSVSVFLTLDAAGPQPFRLILGNKGRGSFVRRFEVAPGPWREVTLRLADFRDSPHHLIPDLARIDRVELRWDKGEGTVRVDDLRVTPGTRGAASSQPTVEERLAFAFPDGRGKAQASAHFQLLTDVPELQGKPGEQLLARLEESRQVLIDAFRLPPAPPESPLVPVHVFSTREAYVAFVGRLGERVGAKIEPPGADGFSIMRMALSSYAAGKGWDRPVFAHEAVHGAICQMLGIATDGNWVQEGLANAVQLRLHPASAKDVDFAAAFAEGGSFVPWSRLFEKPRTTTREYAQLLTIFEFLAASHADRLPEVWKALGRLEQPLHRDGPAAVARAVGTTPQDLEAAWLAWGRAKYPKKAG